MSVRMSVRLACISIGVSILLHICTYIYIHTKILRPWEDANVLPTLLHYLTTLLYYTTLLL